MQIVQVPMMPATSVTMPSQTIANVLPQVQAQAVQPISQQAIQPTPKSEKGADARARDEDDEPTEGKAKSEERGGHVNLSV